MKNEIMHVKVFKLPAFSDSDEEDKLNKFLRSHRILQVVKAFSMDNGGSWAVLVEYMDGDQTEIPSSRRSAKDYSKELSPEEYERYSRFREIRKKISEEKNIPPYLVFTNEELALLARYNNLTKEILKGIKDIPARRLADYGDFLISDNEKSKGLDDSDMPF